MIYLFSSCAAISLPFLCVVMDGTNPKDNVDIYRSLCFQFCALANSILCLPFYLLDPL
jgi:hypothetical protein